MNLAILSLALLTPTAPPTQKSSAPDVSESVNKGLKWLASQQEKDGGWKSLNNIAPTPMNAMAGMALLMEGSTLKSGTYAPNLRKLVEWFEKNVTPDGKLISSDPNEAYQYMLGHAGAMLFLACVYDVDDNSEQAKRIAKLMDKAIEFVESCQSSHGGWSYVSAKENSDYDDTQSTASVLQALFAARKAGFNIPKKLTDRGTEYLVKATNRDGGIIYSTYGGALPMGNDGQPFITATAAAGLLMSDGARPPTLPKWVKSANVTNPQQLQIIRNGGVYALLQQLQSARVVFSLGESGHRQLDPEAGAGDLAKWSTYRPKLFKTLKELQGKDGSWPDQTFGPAYSTATALVILQLDNDFLPAFSR